MTTLAPPLPSPRLALELALLLLLATLWGASYAFIKIAVATIPPFTLMAGRTLLAGLVLLLALRIVGASLPRDLATWRLLAVQGVINSVIPFTLIAWGQQTVDAGLAVILNSTTPVFAFLITVAITRHEATSARKLVGVAAGLFGVTIIVGGEALAGLGREVLAQAAIVLATLSYACGAIAGKRLSHLHPLAAAGGSLLVAAAILIPASLLVDRPWTLAPAPSSLAALVALAVFSTALAFTIYFRLVRTLGSVGTTAQAYLRVPIGVAIGIVFLGERLEPVAIVGLVCVVVGVVAMNWPVAKRAA